MAHRVISQSITRSRQGLSLLRNLPLLLLACFCASLSAADLSAYTEEWPPYNFSDKDQVKGIATDILRAACAEAKITCDIQIVPWARALSTVSTMPNSLLYTTARKPSREKDFLWIGPILPRSTWVFSKANDPAIPDFNALARKKTGVIRGEASIEDLELEGIPGSAMTVESSNALVLKLLTKGWIDAMVDTEIGMGWNLRNAGLPQNTVKKDIRLSDKGAYYFAMNLKSDLAIRDRLQSAVEKLRHRGNIDKIILSYTSTRQ